MKRLVLVPFQWQITQIIEVYKLGINRLEPHINDKRYPDFPVYVEFMYMYVYYGKMAGYITKKHYNYSIHSENILLVCVCVCVLLTCVTYFNSTTISSQHNFYIFVYHCKEYIVLAAIINNSIYYGG